MTPYNILKTKCIIFFFLKILFFLKNFFDTDFFLSLLEFVAILLLFYVLVFWPQGLKAFSSQTRG